MSHPHSAENGAAHHQTCSTQPPLSTPGRNRLRPSLAPPVAPESLDNDPVPLTSSSEAPNALVAAPTTRPALRGLSTSAENHASSNISLSASNTLNPSTKKRPATNEMPSRQASKRTKKSNQKTSVDHITKSLEGLGPTAPQDATLQDIPQPVYGSLLQRNNRKSGKAPSSYWKYVHKLTSDEMPTHYTFANEPIHQTKPDSPYIGCRLCHESFNQGVAPRYVNHMFPNVLGSCLKQYLANVAEQPGSYLKRHASSPEGPP
jgi:hypothetical protein